MLKIFANKNPLYVESDYVEWEKSLPTGTTIYEVLSTATKAMFVLTVRYYPPTGDQYSLEEETFFNDQCVQDEQILSE